MTIAKIFSFDFLNELVTPLDETFFIYNDDTDFSWNLFINGFKVLYVPTSKIKHDFNLEVSPNKLYHLEKGRYIILRKYLSLRDFIMLSPSLLTVELLTIGYSLKIGRLGLKHKFKAMKEGLQIKILKVENKNKSNLFKSLNPTIPINQLTTNFFEKFVLSIANKIFYINFRRIR